MQEETVGKWENTSDTFSLCRMKKSMDHSFIFKLGNNVHIAFTRTALAILNDICLLWLHHLMPNLSLIVYICTDV